jgi:uncharacterized protein with FMN-binding domain
MRIPHIRTLLSIIGTVGAMVGLVAAKTAVHRPPPKVHLADKTVTGTGPRAVTTVTGPPVPIAHGVVQVRITVTAGLISGVTATRLPHDNDVSWTRSNLAAAMLDDEVMKAQSAHVDAVSGATYTSEAYLASLQAAIDAAEIPES